MSLIIKISFTVAFFAIFFGAVDQASAACPTVTPMANFDASKFVGTWFAIRRYSTILNGFATSCITMNSTFSNQNIFSLQLNNLFSQRTPIRIVGTLLSNGIYNLKLQVGLVSYIIKYIIVATDYTNYAAAHFCETLPFVETAEVSWIYSRTRVLSQTYLTTAINALKAKNIILQNFVDISQNGCT